MDFLFQWGKGMFVENEGLYSFFTSTSGEKIMSELVIDDRFSFPDSLKDILVRIFSRKKRRLSPKKKTVCFWVEMPEEAVERLETLRKNLGVETRAEVFSKSLGILDMLVQEQKDGGVLILRSKDGEESRVVL